MLKPKFKITFLIVCLIYLIFATVSIASCATPNLKYTKSVSIKTANGAFVCAKDGGGSEINASCGSPQGFTVIGNLVYGGPIALQTFDGKHYVSAKNGGGDGLNAESTTIGNDEIFKVMGPNLKSDGSPVNIGDNIVFQTFDGKHFICAVFGGQHELTADRLMPQEWETFTFQAI